MNRLIQSTMMILLTVGMALPAFGQLLPTARPGPDAAQISGVPGQPINELFGVRFVAIDGTNIQARSTMWLKPGSYTLTVMIDAAHVRSPPSYSRRTQRLESGYNQIELELEAGKTYEIRSLYDRTNRDAPFSVVLHQVKDH